MLGFISAFAIISLQIMIATMKDCYFSDFLIKIILKNNLGFSFFSLKITIKTTIRQRCITEDDYSVYHSSLSCLKKNVFFSAAEKVNKINFKMDLNEVAVNKLVKNVQKQERRSDDKIL